VLLVVLLALIPTGVASAGTSSSGQPPSSVVWLERAGTALSAEDFDVLVGGESAEVVAVERLAPSAPGADPGPWQVLVYFDTPLLTPEALKLAVRVLSEHAAQLAALGPVTITVADPEPRDLLTAGLREHRIHEALELFADQTTLAGELLWRRLRYLNAVQEGEIDDEGREGALRHERQLLDRQRSALRASLVSRRTDGPGLLILVQDGFDLDFKRFYVSRTELLEGLASDVVESHSELARQSAAAGWTILPLALGEQGSEFDRPQEPLRLLAEATGGELVTSPRQLRRALEETAGPVKVSYRPPAAASGSQPLEVRFKDREVRGPLWAATVSSSEQMADLPSAPSGDGRSAIRLLSPGPGPHVGPTRLTAITGEHEVDYVAFFLDGFLVDVSRSAPFRARIDLGPEPAPRTVRAAAYSPGALELGDDTLELNLEDRPFRVDIVEVVGDPWHGSVEIEAAVSTPIGRTLERLDFYWNEELRQSLEAPPFTAAIATEDPETTDYYRVIAHLDDGTSLETARMVTEIAEASDRLDINLVELYALVSDRGARPSSELTRDDFELFHGGESRQIQQVAPAGEVPLTLGLAVDTSQSLSYWHDDLREAAAVFFENALGERDQAFLTDFDVRARLTQTPTQQRELLVGRMAALDFGGYTSLYDAILFSLAQFEDQGGRKALVVLTDGNDASSRFRPKRCVEEAARLGVPIYMVVVEDPSDPLDNVERLMISQMAEQSGGRIYFFTSRERLEEIYAQIVNELHSQYLLTWASDRPLRAADLRDIRVEVRDRKLSVRTVLGSSVRRQ
jgi:VWFA-related protein